jgi:hypothetical protein
MATLLSPSRSFNGLQPSLFLSHPLRRVPPYHRRQQQLQQESRQQSPTEEESQADAAIPAPALQSDAAAAAVEHGRADAATPDNTLGPAGWDATELEYSEQILANLREDEVGSSQKIGRLQLVVTPHLFQQHAA